MGLSIRIYFSYSTHLLPSFRYTFLFSMTTGMIMDKVTTSVLPIPTVMEPGARILCLIALAPTSTISRPYTSTAMIILM